jgi:enoyl-CoA hydratase/carnithine racemase
MQDELIVCSQAGRVGVIQLNRPGQLNALNDALMDALGAALLRMDADAGVGCILIKGHPRAFAAGADVHAMRDKSYAEVVSTNFISRNWETILAVRKPVVAAVAGFALGAGCELAMMCDIVIAADTACFGQPEIKLGIIPGAGGTQRLARLIGPARAKDLIFSGRMVDAEEALRIGLADRVAPAAEVYATAQALVRPYVTGPSLALRAAKQAIDSGLNMDLASGLALESQLFASLFATDDRIEGTSAFVAKRKPTFTGR